MTTRPSHPPPAPSTGEASPERDLEGALHDVSNALTVVIGWLDRARALPQADDLAEALRIADAHARSGRHIARRAIGAEAPAEGVPAHLAELLDHAWLGVAPHAGEKALVRVGAASAAVAVEEPAALAQVITNLLMNAVAFSPNASSIELSAEAHGASVVIRVRDEGEGVPESRRASIFQRGRSTRPGGAGIGLAYSRALARRASGSLELEATPSGASFALTWPIARGAAPKESPSREVATVGPARVLVVEDDPAVLILLETALSARGADIVCARDLRDLDDALKQGAFDAALVDLSPLGPDPEATLAKLRAASPKIRVVVISGSATSSAVLALTGVAAWVRKPFDIGEIVAALR